MLSTQAGGGNPLGSEYKLLIKRIMIKAITVFSAYTHPACFIKSNSEQRWALMGRKLLVNRWGMDNFLTQSSANDFNTLF